MPLWYRDQGDDPGQDQSSQSSACPDGRARPLSQQPLHTASFPCASAGYRFAGRRDFGKTLKLHRIGEDSAPNYVLWAACRSDRYSADADVGGTLGGAFTYFFCKHIRDTAGKVNRSEMLKLVRASLKHEGFSRSRSWKARRIARREASSYRQRGRAAWLLTHPPPILRRINCQSRMDCNGNRDPR